MWKQIRDFNYEVNEQAIIRNIKTKQILKPVTSWNGYLSVCFSLGKRGKRKKLMLHRIVAEAFLANPENKKEVNHKNMDHAVKLGRILSRPGEKHPRSKITDKLALEIKHSKETTKFLAEKFKLGIRTIQRIRSGQAWTHL